MGSADVLTSIAAQRRIYEPARPSDRVGVQTAAFSGDVPDYKELVAASFEDDAKYVNDAREFFELEFTSRFSTFSQSCG